jgi:signal peptidase I
MATSAVRPAPQIDWVNSAQSLLVTVVIAIFVIAFIVQAFQIPSESMENTLLIGDYLLVNKLQYGDSGLVAHLLPYKPVKRGEIIVFHYPIHPEQHFVKRVIAVPGDRLRLINRRVYVNGSLVNEPYTRYSSPVRDPFRDDFPRVDEAVPGLDSTWWLQMRKLVEDGQLIIPQDCYFVMGDNRDESLDSRYWGFVPRENIVGSPLLIYWSVKESEPDGPDSPDSPGKLSHLAYVMTHILQITRWNRTLRLVN